MKVLNSQFCWTHKTQEKPLSCKVCANLLVHRIKTQNESRAQDIAVWMESFARDYKKRSVE